MRTKRNSKLYILLGSKNDGKTTIGSYLLHKRDEPSVIFDVARQFEPRDYRIICNSVSELGYYLKNKVWMRAFRKGSLQLVFRPTPNNLTKEIERACELLFGVHNITIFFEEMELYADGYMRKTSNIFQICYLMRNRGHTIIAVAKQASKLSTLIKDMYDYFFVGSLETKTSLRFFDDMDRDLVKKIKSLRFREFLIIGRHGYTRSFKLRPGIAKVI